MLTSGFTVTVYEGIGGHSGCGEYGSLSEAEAWARILLERERADPSDCDLQYIGIEPFGRKRAVRVVYVTQAYIDHVQSVGCLDPEWHKVALACLAQQEKA